MIEWPDGHQSSFAFEALRASCPCAACRDARSETTEAAGSPPSAEATRLVRIEPVGRYGVALIWGDGHNTGIYPWDYLRERCDCLACRLARREARE